jgi:hypothetical protein
MITAEGTPFGATINTSHITNVRWQPMLRPAGPEPDSPLVAIPNSFEVIIALIDGAHSLTFDSQQKAQDEYHRLSNEVRGALRDELPIH